MLFILAGFVFYGLFFGLIRAIGSLAGVIAGVWAAVHYYLPAYAWAKDLFFGYDTIGKVITFILLFTIINRLLGLAFSLLDRTFHLLSIIPFLKTINRLGGAIFGFLEGGLVLGLIIFVLEKNFLLGGWFASIFSNSRVVPYLVKFIEALAPILPEALAKLKFIIL